MGGFGFASGLPLSLIIFTLRQWLTEAGISKRLIGATAVIGLAYTLKFLWSPLFDQMPPGAIGRVGRRRGWLLVVQPLLTMSMVALAFGDPAAAPRALFGVACAVAFLSACQDIAIDAWRIESFASDQQGRALACYIWGYRTAMLVSGTGAVWLVGPLGWRGSLLLMAALSLAGVLSTLLATEPRVPPSPRLTVGLRAQFEAAVTAPLRDLLSRPGAIEILAFVLLFYLGEAMAQTMSLTFYKAVGFTRNQVVAANTPSLAATLVGAAAGGWGVARFGVGRALLCLGFVQMATMLFYFGLASGPASVTLLTFKVCLEACAEAAASAAFLAFLSSLCSPGYSATQYALLSSLAAVALHTLAGASGVLADWLGWRGYYAFTLAAALPAMLILLDLMRRDRAHGRIADDAELPQ